MTEWPTHPLGDVCTVAAGGTPSRRRPEFYGGGIPWVKITDMLQGRIMSTEETISRAGLEGSSAKLMPSGTVLISIFATIGRTAVLGVEAATNQAIAGITPRDPSALLPGYLRRFLDSVVTILQERARGVAQVNISSTILRSIPIPVPPLDEQRRIADVLDRAEALRAKRRAAIEQLEVLKQSIFLEMFGTGDERNWPSKPLSMVVSPETIVTYGIVQAGPEHAGGVPYIRTGDIVDGRIDLRNLRHTDPTIASRFARSRVHVGEIVMSIRATVGTTAVVPEALDGANLTQGTARIAPGPEVDRDYLLNFLRSHRVQHWIQRQVKGATFREITLGRLRDLPVTLPPLELQRSFLGRLGQLDRCSWASESSHDQLRCLYDSLQRQAFQGEL